MNNLTVFTGEIANKDFNGLDWEELVSVGLEARSLRDISQLVLGRLALSVEIKFGQDSLGKFAAEIKVPKQTLKRYRWVVKNWPELQVGTPTNELSFTHYEKLTPMDKKQEWLEKAADNSWSVERMMVEIGKSDGKDYGLIECPSCHYKFKK